MSRVCWNAAWCQVGRSCHSLPRSFACSVAASSHNGAKRPQPIAGTYPSNKNNAERSGEETSMPEAQKAGRTYGRWYILGVICLMYLITYLDRVIMQNTAKEMQQEFGFD